MATSFSYIVGVDFLQGVDLSRLTKEVQESAITIALDHISQEGSTVTLFFKANLSAGEETILYGDVSPASGLIGAHVGTPLVEVTTVQTAAPKTADGRDRVAIEKSDGSRLTQVTHDFTKKTTWYRASQRVEDEVLVEVTELSSPPGSPNERDCYYVGLVALGAWAGQEGKIAIYGTGSWRFVDLPAGWSFGVRKLYRSEEEYLIDVYHGLLWNEDKLRDSVGNTYRVTVANDVQGALTEKDPFDDAGDFLVDYRNGLFFVDASQGVGEVISATYYTATNSHYIVAPTAGKKIQIESVDVQFSEDVNLRDTAIFEMWGFVDAFAPQLLQANGGPYPSGTKIPIDTTKYKTMRDFQAECDRAYPPYPAMGGSTWRGLQHPTFVFHWEYVRGVSILSSLGMELHIYLEHDQPYLGSYATATLYCVSESE